MGSGWRGNGERKESIVLLRIFVYFAGYYVVEIACFERTAAREGAWLRAQTGSGQFAPSTVRYLSLTPAITISDPPQRSRRRPRRRRQLNPCTNPQFPQPRSPCTGTHPLPPLIHPPASPQSSGI